MPINPAQKRLLTGTGEITRRFGRPKAAMSQITTRTVKSEEMTIWKWLSVRSSRLCGKGKFLWCTAFCVCRHLKYENKCTERCIFLRERVYSWISYQNHAVLSWFWNFRKMCNSITKSFKLSHIGLSRRLKVHSTYAKNNIKLGVSLL